MNCIGSFTLVLVWVPFVCFTHLIVLVRTSSLTLNKSDVSGHLCHVLRDGVGGADRHRKTKIDRDRVTEADMLAFPLSM